MQSKLLAVLAASSALAITACGGDGDTSKTAAAKPAATPVATIPTLSGKDTAVTLDAGFVKALGTLKLTPAPVGSAEISKAGGASSPTTGCNVTSYTPASTPRYVQGRIAHEGGGLSRPGGGKTVELTNFEI